MFQSWTSESDLRMINENASTKGHTVWLGTPGTLLFFYR
jgi:hypothetical protein